mgnify:CR=1 FL=1
MSRLIVGLCCALIVAGCSEKPNVTGSMEEAKVKGVVRVRGKAVNNGSVTFRASNINRPNAPTKETPIGKDGTFEVSAFIGNNFVEVSCKELMQPKNRMLLENERMIEIKPGDNTLDLDIPPEPAK